MAVHSSQLTFKGPLAYPALAYPLVPATLALATLALASTSGPLNVSTHTSQDITDSEGVAIDVDVDVDALLQQLMLYTLKISNTLSLCRK